MYGSWPVTVAGHCTLTRGCNAEEPRGSEAAKEGRAQIEVRTDCIMDEVLDYSERTICRSAMSRADDILYFSAHHKKLYFVEQGATPF